MSRIGVLILDCILMHFAKLYKKCDVYEIKLNNIEKLCIVSNMLIETVFISHITKYYADTPLFPYTHNLFGFFIVFTRVLLISIIDDILYSPYHYLLHRPFLFRYIHGIHHKIDRPYKGYIHAIMEHPFEMIGALYLHTIALHIVNFFVYIDQTSIYLHILLKACLACLNHSGHEVDIKLIHYKSLSHLIHHRYRTINYFQHIEIKLPQIC